MTNGDRRQQRRKIERYDLARYFDVMVIEGKFGCGKPEEAVYRHALAAPGARPEDAFMVGDHLEWDVGAPQRLGVRGFGWTAPERGSPSSRPSFRTGSSAPSGAGGGLIKTTSHL